VAGSRFDALIRRREGERAVHLDWHPPAAVGEIRRSCSAAL
jgi:hypothetical protein